MLERIELRNFQRHRRLAVDLGPVTCFVGDNGAGKSSVLRALRWACLNEPPGDWMITHGKTRTRVTLHVDSRVLVREKGTNNLYVLDGEEYKAFGTGVPDEIANLVNVNYLNFQSQLEPVFWFADTPGKVSRELNAVVNLDIIDDTLSRAGSLVRDANARVEACAVEADRAAKARSALEWVPGAVEAFERLSGAYTRSEALVQECDELTFMCTELQSLDQRIANAREGAQSLAQGVQACERLSGEVDELERLTRSLALANGAESKSVQLARVLAALGESDRITEEYHDLAALVADVQDKEEQACRAEKSSTAALKTLEEKSGGVCPLCGKAGG